MSTELEETREWLHSMVGKPVRVQANFNTGSYGTQVAALGVLEKHEREEHYRVIDNGEKSFAYVWPEDVAACVAHPEGGFKDGALGVVWLGPTHKVEWEMRQLPGVVIAKPIN